MYRKHTIYYTLATFWGCRRHQNIGIWGTQNPHFPVTTVPTYRYQKSTFSVLVTTMPPYLAPGCLLPGTLDPDPGCQDIKLPSRARPLGLLPPLQSHCPGAPKSSILRPTPRYAVMYRKHTIYYTLPTFWGCQRHQTIGIWGTQNHQFGYRSPQYPHIGTTHPHFRSWSPPYHPTWHPVVCYQIPGILTQGAKISRYLRARGPMGPYPPFRHVAPGSQNPRFHDPHRGML